MNFTERFQNITTLPELYQFRDDLRGIAEDHSSTKSRELDLDKLKVCQNANWFISQVEARITQLGEQGVWLDKISKPELPK